MAQSSSSRLGLCQTCSAAPAKYTCPACAFPSCSLPCSTAHKQATNCSGVAPPLWSKPIQANEMTWGSLMRDQSYIAGVSRAVEEVGRQLVGDKLIPQGRRAGPAEETVRLDERSDKEEKMVREARNDGVELLLLPKGMSKRIKNGTRWDPKNNRLEWTVEVLFQPRPLTDRSAPPQPPTLITTVPQPSTATLYSVLSAALAARDKKGKGKAIDPEDAKWIFAEKEWVETFKPAAVEKEVPTAEGEVEGEAVAAEGAADGKPAGTEESVAPEAGPSSPSTAPAPLPQEPATSPIPAPPDLVVASDDSPFVLVLAFYLPPTSAPSTTFDPDSPDSSAPAPSPNQKAAGRPVYLLSPTPALTLQAALSGATLLETPTFELWPRESFLRQKLLGKLRVIDKPTELPERGGGWERGRGRGRGRGTGAHSGGRGRGRGRGGYAGQEHGQARGWEASNGDAGRTQDSGWGKRASDQVATEQDTKKLRREEPAAEEGRLLVGSGSE
ncbi:hypothetical protein JCM1841_005919 [Sporobolomyces salmonicolor]